MVKDCMHCFITYLNWYIYILLPIGTPKYRNMTWCDHYGEWYNWNGHLLVTLEKTKYTIVSMDENKWMFSAWQSVVECKEQLRCFPLFPSMTMITAAQFILSVTVTSFILPSWIYMKYRSLDFMSRSQSVSKWEIDCKTWSLLS